MNNFKIADKKIGSSCKPYIIAELSANHNGSLEKAIESISMAKKCGADAVKLQTYTADTMTIKSTGPDFMISGGLWDGYSLYELYKEAETPFSWMKKLFNHGKNIGITVFSTPFDESAVDLLEDLKTPAYKVASFEIVDIPLLKYIAHTKKPVIMSTGMASKEEIDEAVNVLKKWGTTDILLMHCISSYPAPVDQSNLRQISELSKRFGCPVGLSDHTLGTTVSIGSIATGAVAIEKHFTLDRSQKGPDSEFSIEPNELQDLCTKTKEVWQALGQPTYSLAPAEEGNKAFRRSIYFIKDLSSGSVVKKEHIKRIRPGFGLPPKYFNQLIGKKVNQDVKAGQRTSWGIFSD